MEITREILSMLYITEKKTMQEIADIYGYKSGQSISHLLKKYKIPSRKGRDAQNAFNMEYDKLYNMYIIEKKTTQEIANIVNSSDEVIRRLLIYNGIERRSNTINFGGYNKGTHLPESTLGTI